MGISVYRYIYVYEMCVYTGISVCMRCVCLCV